VRYKKVVEYITTIGTSPNRDFLTRSSDLEQMLVPGWTDNLLLEHLTWAGVIPERFGHDSTEEKLYAKYCDMLLAAVLTRLGITSTVLKVRADSADVKGVVPGRYSLAGDAKAFRLSRTAKNQKDFKVVPLDKWRKDAKADYAVLVCPYYQYPMRSSQIYEQAATSNVALLSYYHLRFLVEQVNSQNIRSLDLEPLWLVNRTRNLAHPKHAQPYWQGVATITCKITGQSLDVWASALQRYLNELQAVAQTEILYLEDQRGQMLRLNHAEAIQQLLEASKVDSKIVTIRDAIAGRSDQDDSE